MTRAAPLALALLMGSASAIGAQLRVLQPGDETRIFVLGVISPFEGVLLAAEQGDLRLTTVDGAEMTIPLDQVERSDVRASRANTLLGAAVGGGLGLATGVGLLVARDANCTRDATGFCDPGDTFNQWLLVVPSAVGIVAGALLGSVVRTGRWVPALLPRPLGHGSAGVGLAWSLPLAH